MKIQTKDLTNELHQFAIRWLPAIASIFLLSSVSLPANAFDGKKDYICTIETILQCGERGVCLSGSKEGEGIAPFLEIFPERNTASPAGGDGADHEVLLTHAEAIDELFIIQGTIPWISNRRGPVGWTMTIQGESGSMVIAGSHADGVLVGYGNCLNR